MYIGANVLLPAGYDDPASAATRYPVEYDAVVARWQAKDLRAYLAAHWATLGPTLHGEIYLYVGDTDTYYLDDAVELLQQQLDAETAPPADATFVYGHEKPHGWSPYTAQQWFAIYATYVAAHVPAGTSTAAWHGAVAAPAGQPADLPGVIQGQQQR
jgi:hypothetical protein